jgi:predicted ATPase
MIRKVLVENYKSHSRTEIEIGSLTALVGPNGCGKTALLQAAHFLYQLAEQPLEQVFSGEQHPAHIVKRGARSLTVLTQGEALLSPWVAQIDVGWPAHYSAGWVAEVGWQWDNEIKSHQPLLPNQTLGEVAPKEMLLSLGQAAYFKPVPKSLAAASYAESIPPNVAPDGSGLASTVAYLMTYQPQVYRELEEMLRVVVPNVEQIRVKPAKVMRHERKFFSYNETHVPFDDQRELTGQELVFDTTGAREVPAHSMSEGTLLVLGLLTLLLGGSGSPHLVLLDDVEQGLHPRAQRELVHLLRQLVDGQERQIILTSHSPYILDELNAEEVYVMASDQAGTSVVRRLSEHPDAERALSVLTTGEFWDAEGESWVFEEPEPTEEVNA